MANKNKKSRRQWRLCAHDIITCIGKYLYRDREIYLLLFLFYTHTPYICTPPRLFTRITRSKYLDNAGWIIASASVETLPWLERDIGATVRKETNKKLYPTMRTSPHFFTGRVGPVLYRTAATTILPTHTHDSYYDNTIIRVYTISLIPGLRSMPGGSSWYVTRGRTGWARNNILIVIINKSYRRLR